MHTVIGLDIGHTSYRAVEIGYRKVAGVKKPVLNKAVICETCPDPDPNKSAENLKDFIKSSNFSTKEVVLSLPESGVFTTILSLPFKTDKQIKGYFDIQSSNIFPRPLSELVYSFVNLGPSEQNKDETEVNVVACGKEYVEKLIETARTIGLKAISVESDSFSIVRALIRNHDLTPNEAILIVNVGFVGTDMMVVRGGNVRFSRNISVGGEAFNKSIAQSLGVTEEQAEEYRKSYGLDAELLGGKVRQAITPLADTVLNEIKRTMNFYTTRNNFCSFNRILYCGGSVSMPGLLSYSAENLDIEVELANPFTGLEFSPKILSQKDKLTNLGPLYTVAVGLALKELI
jgi:type IV pilus assembly protein PilM